MRLHWPWTSRNWALFNGGSRTTPQAPSLSRSSSCRCKSSSTEDLTGCSIPGEFVSRRYWFWVQRHIEGWWMRFSGSYWYLRSESSTVSTLAGGRRSELWTCAHNSRSSWSGTPSVWMEWPDSRKALLTLRTSWWVWAHGQGSEQWAIPSYESPTFPFPPTPSFLPRNSLQVPSELQTFIRMFFRLYASSPILKPVLPMVSMC